MICLEKCENTLDYLLENELIDEPKCISALMQIVMTLIVYQKTLSRITILHTNNIMYIETDKEFIYYTHNQIHYKVPTYGRIYKIIDFGRSIYRFKNKMFYSDCFEKHGTQTGSTTANRFE
jgi:hypothetical protein